VAADWLLSNSKKLLLNLLLLNTQRFGDAIGEQQEIAAAVADLAIEIYLGESALLRTKKALQQGKHASVMSSLTLVFIHGSLKRMEHQACITYTALETGTELDSRLASIRKLFAWTPPNVIELRRSIAKCLCASGDLTSILEESHAIR